MIALVKIPILSIADAGRFVMPRRSIRDAGQPGSATNTMQLA
jgi:hypothetical protein